MLTLLFDGIERFLSTTSNASFRQHRTLLFDGIEQIGSSASNKLIRLFS